MKLTKADLPTLYPALLIALAMLAVGAGRAYLAREALRTAERQHQATQAERNEIDGRLKRVRNEEQEIKRKNAIFTDLRTRGVIGEEQRLEWSEQISAIRERRRLPQLEYEIAPQTKLESIPGNFSIHASSMKMSARLLHEEDLINLIDDLRRDARALILVRACALSRLARTVSDTTATPHLQAECQIEWITLQGPASALASGGRQ